MQAPRPTLRERVAELHRSPAVAWATFAAIGALLVLIHLFRNGIDIDHRELWLDESSTFMVAQYPLRRLLTLPTEFHSQPPFYYMLLHLVSLLDSSETVIRGLSWSVCLATVAFVMLELNELRIVSRVAFSLLFIFNEHTLFLARELRPYGLGVLATLVASVLFLRLVRRPHDRRLFALYVLAALAMAYTLSIEVWTLATHGLVGAAVILSAIRRDGLRAGVRATWPIAAALSTVAALYLPFLIFAVRHEPPPGHHPLAAARLAEALKGDHITDYLRQIPDARAPFSFVLWGLMLYGGLRELRRGNRSVLLWGVLLFGQIAFAHGFLLGKVPVAFRYLGPAFPAYLMLVAYGVEHIVAWRPASFAPAAITALALMAGDARKPFETYLTAPVPAPNWRRLYTAMAKIPGPKAIFFDTGFYGQNLEYVARKDRSFTFLMDGYETLADTGMCAGGKPMSRAYIEREVAALAGEQRCFFYANDRRGSGREPGRETSLYPEVFVPAMEKLGFTKQFTLESDKAPDTLHDYYVVNGFCRP